MVTAVFGLITCTQVIGILIEDERESAGFRRGCSLHGEVFRPENFGAGMHGAPPQYKITFEGGITFFRPRGATSKEVAM